MGTFSYQVKYIYPSTVKNFMVSDIGCLNINSEGSWKSDVNTAPYKFYIAFIPNNKINTISIKEFQVYYDNADYTRTHVILNNKEMNEEGKYYFRYMYLREIPDNIHHIRYKITLIIDGVEYYVEIPVKIIRKTSEENKLIFLY
jgi:hypothetical protein